MYIDRVYIYSVVRIRWGLAEPAATACAIFNDNVIVDVITLNPVRASFSCMGGLNWMRLVGNATVIVFMSVSSLKVMLYYT